jgi:transposase
MVVRRRQLIAMLVAERNRLHPSHPQNKKSINTIIKALEDELLGSRKKWTAHP